MLVWPFVTGASFLLIILLKSDILKACARIRSKHKSETMLCLCETCLSDTRKIILHSFLSSVFFVFLPSSQRSGNHSKFAPSTVSFGLHFLHDCESYTPVYLVYHAEETIMTGNCFPCPGIRDTNRSSVNRRRTRCNNKLFIRSARADRRIETVLHKQSISRSLSAPRGNSSKAQWGLFDLRKRSDWLFLVSSVRKVFYQTLYFFYV